MATILDYILDEDRDAYNAIIERASIAKMNAPKPERKPRAPLTEEQKEKALESRLSKLQAKLAAMRAASAETVDAE